MRFSNQRNLKAVEKLLYPLGIKKHRWRYSTSTRVLSDIDASKNTESLLEFDTLHKLQTLACDVYSKNPLYGTFNESTSRFEYMSYADFGRKVQECRLVLKDLGTTSRMVQSKQENTNSHYALFYYEIFHIAGVNSYDKVAIVSNNRYEWAMIAAATYSLNATLVPMYEAQLSADWKYIVNDSSASVVFCSTKNVFRRFSKEALPMTPSVHSTICLDDVNGEEYGYETIATSINDIRYLSRHSTIVTPPSEEDLANLIYTSGTTGNPKGVELTHRNIVSNIKGARLMSQNPFELLNESSRTLAFLPWAHSYGQTVELWMGMSFGSSSAICRGIPHILEDMQLVKPTILFAVPTLYKKVFDGVKNQMESGNFVKDTLLKNAIRIGNEKARSVRGERGDLGTLEKVKFSVLDTLVLSKIRDRFGGKLKYGCVAGAACPSDVLRFMDSVGIPVLEGYGLTETSPIITLNSPSHRRIGSVGRPLQDVQVYIMGKDGPMPPGEEGEICCVGPNVMKGYHKNKSATEEVMTTAPDGKSRMFRTGDLGTMNEKGWITVTGRIKEQYKLENGKYVVPAPIENAIGTSRFIDQVVLYGANRPYNIALIVPNWTTIRQQLDLDDDVSEADIASNMDVREMIDYEIRKCCSRFKKFEIPRDWAFVAPFTAANNMLTPKMSIRKHNVVQAYSDLIDNLYGDDPIKSTEGDHDEAMSAAA